jgi:hypothetical protein
MGLSVRLQDHLVLENGGPHLLGNRHEKAASIRIGAFDKINAARREIHAESAATRRCVAASQGA